MKDPYRRLRLACYTSNISMSVVANLPPLLFLTFRSMYGLSFSQLGLLILINYCTQLTVDLIFSFFSHRFNIPLTVKLTPALTVTGLLLYALWPFLCPGAVYPGLLLGTVVFSSAAGLVEVLISPVIAAIPAEDPDREMSKLHSVYAWGVVGVVPISTLFLLAFGNSSWQWLMLLFVLVPLTSVLLFAGAEIPSVATPEKTSGSLQLLKNPGLLLSILAIFLGGAAECTMAQWSSSYLEQAFRIPKVWGDMFGVTLFALMLGLGRTIYAKYGKNLSRLLFLSVIGAAACYLIAAVTSQPIVALAACALTGLCTAMLWPGNLVIASERFPAGGVFVFAAMASGGDLGAAVAPQLVGMITDAAIASPLAVQTAASMSIAPEQLGMKLGILVGMLFPLAAIFVQFRLFKTSKVNKY